MPPAYPTCAANGVALSMTALPLRLSKLPTKLYILEISSLQSAHYYPSSKKRKLYIRFIVLILLLILLSLQAIRFSQQIQQMALGNQKVLPLWRSKYVLWVFLMLPGLIFTIGVIIGNMTYESYMHSTGEFCARFLVFSLIASPLIMMLPKYKFPKWLNRNKRYFGLSAFVYGLFHAIAYVVEVPTNQVLAEAFEVGLLTAWISLIIWIPMAITSTDGWVQRLKSTWKRIHNWGYLAALCAFLHWAFVHYHWQPALIHAAPILILQGYRWGKVLAKK